jgi:phospholipase C
MWRITTSLITLALLGCGGDDSIATDASDDGGAESATDATVIPDAAKDAPVDVYVDQHPAYDLHAADRTACTYQAGDLTTTTVGPNVPHGNALPFTHIVFLMMENRSFDSYFSKLPAYGVKDVDVADDTFTNPQPGSPPKYVNRYHETRYCIVNTAHDWGPVHLQYDNGNMDGFIVTNDPGGERAMGYYDQYDLPFYYWLASTFAVSDRHFSSLLGPTWPNRFFFYGATSWGRTMTPDTPPLNQKKIVNEMDDAGRSWKIYRDGTIDFGVVFGPQYAGTAMSNFFTDVANDALPDLSILDPSFSGTGQDDEHPPTNMQKGEQLSASILSALMDHPNVWQKTVFIQTYDEHGGYYDHVPPPLACVPDGNTPPDYGFDRLGIRVPMFVASPFSKKGYVSHLVTDHTSITRFIENRFDLPAMTARDANAWPMLDMFDFQKPPFMTPPLGLPNATPYQAQVDWCVNNPAGTGLP